MKFQELPYRWTYLTGAAFLSSILWTSAFHQQWCLLVGGVSSFCFAISTLASLVLAVIRHSREAFTRVAINALAFALILPVLTTGIYLRDHLFMGQLHRFQEAADLLIRNAKADSKAGNFSTTVSLPPAYWDLHVANTVFIQTTKNNVTVRFTNPDSSALGHSGYMYRSDDDSEALKKEFPQTDVSELAPHWFFYIK